MPAIAERVLALTTRDPARALRVAREALRGGGAREPAGRARLLRAQGHAERAVGEYRAARRSYLAARRIFLRLGLELDHAVSALGLVDACMFLGRAAEALRAADDARRVFVRQGDTLRLARLETNVGNLHHRYDQLDAALRHYERASRLFARCGTAVDRARVDHNRAHILTHLGRRSEAEALYHAAHDVLKAAGEVVQAAQIRYGLACLRFLAGEYAQAIAELEDVRAELAGLGARPLLALADLDLAEVLLAMRLYPEALVLARSAAAWFGAHGVPDDRARCDLFSGIALARSGRFVEAVRALRGAERVFRRSGQRTAQAAVWMARAQLFSLQGSPDRAARLAMRAHVAFGRAGFHVRALAAGSLAAEALLEHGRAPRARSLARLLLRSRSLPGDGFSRARLARTDARAATRMGDHGHALRAYRAALRETERAQSALLVDEWRMGFLQEEPETLREFLGVLLARRPRPRPAEIWRWVGRGRAVAAARIGVAAERAPEVRRQAWALRAELEACYARMWRLHAGASRRLEPGAVQRLERRAARLEGRLRRLASPVVARRAQAAAAEPSREPAAGELRLTYFAAGDRLGVLRQDAHGWTLVPDLAPCAEIDRLVRLFHYQMDVRGTDAPALSVHRPIVVARAREHLAALSRLLLEAVIPAGARFDRLRITPHGSLFRLPFHSLTWRGAPLVESAEVSLDVALHRRDADAARRRGAWVFGGGVAGMEGIKAEIRAVGALLARGGTAVEVRAGPPQIAALAEVAGHGALFHLCGHAVYRADHPEFSALRLADGWLSARDFAGLPLQGACVVLSACETGPRAVVAGEESLGLIRGLLRAGAATVVASLWRVDDRATLRLMTDLYRRWRATGRLGSALRHVQAHAASEERDLYLWGPFSLFGSPDVPWPGSLPRIR